LEKEDFESLSFLQKTNQNIIDSNEYKNLISPRLLNQIIKSFLNIPEDKITIDIIEKSLKTRFSTTLQSNKKLQENV
jgi:hypothetical protein